MRLLRASNGERSLSWLPLVAAIAAAVTVAGCGEDDFPNDPRPPAPVELTVSITDKRVSVSPNEVGGGLVNITISNLSADPATLTLTDPGGKEIVSSGEIVAGGTGAIKTDLAEGDYEVGAGADPAVKPDAITVGPERPSSSNELLQP